MDSGSRIDKLCNLLNQVICDDCLNVMKQIPDNSIDLICTDPPYQLSSTTKKRTDDIAVKGSNGKGNPFCRQQAQKGFMGKEWDVLPSVEIWQECLRVLKPGAFAFIMCCPRQDSLGLMIYRLTEAGFQTGFTSIYWTFASGFPKASNIGKMVDKKLGNEREIVKSNRHGGGSSEIFPERNNKLDSKGNSELEGSYGGFQPKPAVEIILVVMKPLSEKTYVDQAMKNKKGITWLDKGRIPISAEDRHNYGIDGDEGNPTVNCYGEHNRVPYQQDNKGRFPANLLISDDVLDNGEITDSHKNKENIQNEGGSFGGGGFRNISPKDIGSFSRYFSLDKWFESKLKDLSPAVQKVFPFLIVPKASKSEKNEGLIEKQEPSLRPSGIAYNEQSSIHSEKKKGNFHPTTKPIKLMSYLITIGSREQDIILDPFAGSCTTGVACIGLNRQYIMCEKEKEYFEIGKARLDYAKSQLKLI